MRSLIVARMMRSLLLALTVVAVGCTIPIRGVVTKGPNRGAGVALMLRQNGWADGPMTTIAPWGERMAGRYQSGMDGSSYNQTVAAEGAQGIGTADAVVVGGRYVQAGTGTLMGERGGVMELVFYGTPGLAHGQGRGTDTRGNVYRLLW